jgi:negative regulator of sigma E activity
MSLSAKDFELLLEQVGLHRDAKDGEANEPEEFQFERSLTDNALRALAPAKVPEDLSLRIRLALSHERVRAERRWIGRLRHNVELFIETSIRPMALQMAVAAAAIVAVLGGALMLGAVTPQQTVEANEEPLAGFSAPHYLYSAVSEQVVASTNDAPLVVQAMVDRSGRVYDYRLLSGALDENAAAALRQRMLTGVFKPAMVFGQPVKGSVVLTFTDVVVRG